MSQDHVNISIDLGERTLTGFCMRINDEFYETYAVIIDGYQSFSIWLDNSKKSWNASKYANIEPEILNNLLISLSNKLRVSN